MGLAATYLAAGRTREIDVGVATRDGAPVGVFLLWLSDGLGAAFVHAFADARGEGTCIRLPELLRLGVRTFRCYGYSPMTIAIDDDRPRACASGIVANVGELGLAGNVAPDARPDDGRLDALAIQFRPFSWVPLMICLLAGRLPSCWGVHAATATRVSLRSEAPVPLQLDGEVAGWLPVEVTLHPRAVKLIVP